MRGSAAQTERRTIVFDLSGTIELKRPLVVDKSFLTIAGQSAPGDGICIKDHTFQVKNASHIIVRYVRFRLGDQNKPRPSGPDCINTTDVDHVILDHISMSWGIDGNHDLRRGGNPRQRACGPLQKPGGLVKRQLPRAGGTSSGCGTKMDPFLTKWHHSRRPRWQVRH